MTIIYPKGSHIVVLDRDNYDVISIFTEGTCDVSYFVGEEESGRYIYNQTVTNQNIMIAPGASVPKIRLNAGSASTVLYKVGGSPKISRNTVTEVTTQPYIGANLSIGSTSRSTIADAGTVLSFYLRNQLIYQDASLGSVTCTIATGTQLDTELPEMVAGSFIEFYHSSNDSMNTSTLSGAAGVTLIGSGAVTETGGTYLLNKTDTATYELVRVG